MSEIPATPLPVTPPAPPAPAPAPVQTQGGADYVPRTRHNDVLTERSNLQVEVKALKVKLDEALASASGASALQKQLTTLQVDFDAYKGRAEQDLVLIGMGFDDEDGRREMRVQRKKLGDDAPDFAAMIEGYKENPETVPRTLKAYIGGVEAPAANNSNGLPRSKGKVPTAPTGEPLSDQQLAEARDKFRRGKIKAEELQELVDAKLAQMRARR